MLSNFQIINSTIAVKNKITVAVKNQTYFNKEF